MTTTPATPRSLFTVTASTHDVDRCDTCHQQARMAITTATVSGSIGASYGTGDHHAAVLRVSPVLTALALRWIDHPARPCCDAETTLADWTEAGFTLTTAPPIHASVPTDPRDRMLAALTAPGYGTDYAPDAGTPVHTREDGARWNYTTGEWNAADGTASTVTHDELAEWEAADSTKDDDVADYRDEHPTWRG